MLHIGLKIKQLMSQENIDAPALAKKIGKSKQAVYDFLEKEDVNTSLLRELSSVFHVPLSYFVTDGEDDSKEVQLLEVCKDLIKNYQQRDEVMAQLISMVKQME